MDEYIKKLDAFQAKNEFLNPCVVKNTNEETEYATANDGFDGMCGFMVDDIDDGLQDYNGFWHQVEVIGNIHDNPELLRI